MPGVDPAKLERALQDGRRALMHAWKCAESDPLSLEQARSVAQDAAAITTALAGLVGVLAGRIAREVTQPPDSGGLGWRAAETLEQVAEQVRGLHEHLLVAAMLAAGSPTPHRRSKSSRQIIES